MEANFTKLLYIKVFIFQGQPLFDLSKVRLFSFFVLGVFFFFNFQRAVKLFQTTIAILIKLLHFYSSHRIHGCEKMLSDKFGFHIKGIGNRNKDLKMHFYCFQIGTQLYLICDK